MLIMFDFLTIRRYKKLRTHYLLCLRDDQADMAAFFSACFLFFAGSPVNMQSANSTVQVKTGKWPRPDLKVVYVGNDDPTL
ncbi:hypothetical protein HanRHA438_Chr08g0341601 [Helianthus annuus]|nr:hypothetical protein HanRHA438_Chr08g0341601 [Helianthus annuus]